MKCDFSGWATRNNLKCSDGRVIMQDAFKGNDGKTVPLVWNHQHNTPFNVIGHAVLENRKDGVYAYGFLNDTEAGRNSRALIEHGDVSALSIYANQLRQRDLDVLHGEIREVSLVLAGANPGAYIDSVIAHGEESDEEAIIYTGEPLSLSHADEPETPPRKEPEQIQNGDETREKTVGEVFESLTEEQKNAVYAVITNAIEENENSNTGDPEGGKEMKHNVFENEDRQDENTLSHSAMNEFMSVAIADAKRYGSLRDSALAHADDYGIKNIDWLFPEARNLNNPPDFIQREMDWVPKVMKSTHHTPFSRIKSLFADITEDAARAKGYIKGKLKKEEVFSLLKRTTSPTTIYKKQKLDRDDVVDITDFDVVAWLKSEMRMMLDEEIARAILVGDGRLASDDDHINEDNIRPIWKDADLYTIKALVEVKAGATEADRAKAFIRAAIKSRKNYKGSGTPTLFTTEDVLTDCLLLEDGIGHLLYDSEAKLATVLRVKEIVTVPVMENLTRDGSAGKKLELMGLIVNLADYNVGADKGGAVSMFDDFDIDYNQQKYLIETRCSGALTVPYSAIALEMEKATTTTTGGSETNS